MIIKKYPLEYERAKSAFKRALPLSNEKIKTLSGRASTFHQKYLQNYVFIHINKCGGTAIERSLGFPFLNHDTAQERLYKIGEHRWHARYKFTVVRNPYSRIVSKYFYDYQDKSSGYDEMVSAFPKWLQENSNKIRNTRTLSFSDRHLMPASWWISDEEGNIMVDEIFFLEKICVLEKKVINSI